MTVNNPVLDREFVVAGQTRQLTCIETPSIATQQSKPPAAVQKLISELGFRYRPTSQTDLEAHAAALALLCTDLADMPASLLSKAIQAWVVKSPFLPKASDLIALARSILNPPRSAADRTREIPGKELAERRNNSSDIPSGLVWRSNEKGELWLEEYR